MPPDSHTSDYTESDIKTLNWKEHIRIRPGMYIGKLGNGSEADDGLYLLIKEVIDNSIDEFMMGHGKKIHISLKEKTIEIQDFGRGIPLGKLKDCASKINTGAKYDSNAFKKSVGLNGVGIKAVNALSSHFFIQSTRDKTTRSITYSKGIQTSETQPTKSTNPNGTIVKWIPDQTLFDNFSYQPEIIEKMLRHYAYLNTGLTIHFNGKKITSKNGLLDLLDETIKEAKAESLYPPIHLKDPSNDIEIAFTHTSLYGEQYHSFVNGQNTTAGGTHLLAFKEAIVKTTREFFRKNYEVTDIRSGIIAAISIKIVEPIFESQTKTKLGSNHMEPNGTTIRSALTHFLDNTLLAHLHHHPDTAKSLKQKITTNEKERKEINGIKNAAKASAKKNKIHNEKLRDCRIHFNSKHKQSHKSTIFITEGESASGSITKTRNPDFQAVFSLRGKPKNCYGLSRKVVYENKELNLLQHALNIEPGIDHLRYNRIIIATDADVDGMHIRLLLLTFFLHFFPDTIRNKHLFILQTPLFRVRNKKHTTYCYTETERIQAIQKLGPKPEITRFKGLGEISPQEFAEFIGPKMKLQPITMHSTQPNTQLLNFYMGANTPQRQNFIIDNLRVETPILENQKT